MVSIRSAHAYIDAGTAGFMLQMLVATVIGGLFMLKVFWNNVTGKLSKIYALIMHPKAPPD
jgi:hypothetical protein